MTAGADGPPAADVAVYAGEIDAGRNARLFGRYADREFDRLVIDSGGGSVEAGIALGRWVHRHGLDVEVRVRCLSSCANYVFTAGRRKIIRPGAVVAWHGNYRHLLETGLWTDEAEWRMREHGEDEDTARREARALVERLVRLEDAFFREIGVDGYVCWVGKMPPHAVPNYYFLSVEDMARFGIDAVEAPADYPRTDVSGLGVDIRYLDLPKLIP